MSKLIYQTGFYTISMGREPWGHGFLLIEDKRLDDGEFVFDNNLLPNPNLSFDAIDAVLSGLQIEFPQEIKQRLHEHLHHDLGNLWENFYLCPECETWSDISDCCGDE